MSGMAGQTSQDFKYRGPTDTYQAYITGRRDHHYLNGNALAATVIASGSDCPWLRPYVANHFNNIMEYDLHACCRFRECDAVCEFRTGMCWKTG